MPRRDPEKAVQALDAMLEFFDGGSRWTRGELVTGDGQARCLVGALRHVRNELRIRGEGTVHYLRDAAQPKYDDPLYLGISREYFSQLSILWNMRERDDADLMGFNDGSTYDEVRELIAEARAMAQADLDAKRARRRTTKLAQPGRGVAARDMVQAELAVTAQPERIAA
jgi:hypothetical protein